MVLAAENTLFLPAFGDARLPSQQRCDILISNLVRDHAKTQRPRPKDAKRTSFGRLRNCNIDTLTQRNTLSIEPSTSVQFDLFGGIEFRLRGS